LSTTESLTELEAARVLGEDGGRLLVSVIVPTYNRASTLPALLEALAEQDWPADRFEVIVVDDASTDDTATVIAAQRAWVPYRLHYYRKDHDGPAAARNHGVARARGRVLAFTDSDCVPQPGWLSSGVRDLAGGAAIVCGPITPMGRRFLEAQMAPVSRDDGVYPTANLLVRRSAFERAGGFDEGFGVYPWGGLMGGEDTDLAWRIKRSGQRAVFSLGAAVGHQATPISLRAWLLRPAHYQTVPTLVRRIPELRDTHLWGRYFAGRDHLFFQIFWLALLGSAVTRRWLILAATLPWLWLVVPGAWVRVRKGRPDLALGFLLLSLYRYAAETVVLAIGSVRARRLVI
jgi:glycosyltransferase involved in cell wall biosynthesis